MVVREGGERKKSVWDDKVRTELEISKSLEDIFVKKKWVPMEVNHFHRFWGGTHFGVFDGSGSGSGSHFPSHQRLQMVISTPTSTSLPPIPANQTTP